MKTEDRIAIKKAVAGFFGIGRRYVYATPDTQNHSANFYGDTRICKLSRTDVAGCIETAAEGWNWEPDEDPVKAAITAVMADLQYARPEA